MKINKLDEAFSSDKLTISSTFQDGSKINCVVYLPAYYISLKGVNKPPMPIRTTEHVGHATPNNMVKALRVQNITAEPKNKGLGAYLVWRAAERAKVGGAHYLLAMKVNPTTNGWYARMGFTEYDSAVTLDDLKSREEQVKLLMQTAPVEAIEMLSPELEHVMTQKSEMIRFAEVNNVIAKAKGDWEARWQADGNGWKPKAG